MDYNENSNYRERHRFLVSKAVSVHRMQAKILCSEHLRVRFRKQATWLGLLLLLVSGNPVAYANANDDLHLGQRLISHNNYREAIKVLDRAIQQSPGLDNAYGLRGEAYLQLEKRKQARADLDRAIAINGTKWPYYESRSRLKFELNDLDGAIADLNKAIQIDPKGDHLYRLRSKFYILQNKDDKALADLNKAILCNDNDPEGTLRNRGDLYFKMKKYELALKDYTAAINASEKKKDDHSLELDYSARAKAYEMLGKKELAAADRKKVQSVVKDGWGAFLDQDGK